MPRLRKALVKSLDRKAVGHNLRIVRMQYGFTQIDIAVKLGMSQNGYSKIELGRTQLTLEMLILISDLFDMEVQELVSHISCDAVMKPCA